MGLVVRAKDAEAQAQAIQERMSKLQEQVGSPHLLVPTLHTYISLATCASSS